MSSNNKIEISPLLLQDSKEKIEGIVKYINHYGLKFRIIQTERFLLNSIVYEKIEGKWNIHLYNYTRHKQLAFPYIYLSISSILRREKIWFQTINPINLDKLNKRIIIDHFGEQIDFNPIIKLRQEFMQGIYLAFEVDFLLKNKKITNDDALALCYDCSHLTEQAGFCAALKHNGGREQAKVIFDHFWENNKQEHIKIIERIDECLEKNQINEKDFFYIQKVYFPKLKEIDFDKKFDIFMKENLAVLEYDLAISFAGEDRIIAKQIADGLKNYGYKVFYDEYEKSKMWGKDLYEYLSTIYQTKAKYCLILISEHYVKKVWTKLERKSAQARAFLDENEYILPLRLDNTKVPGILPTTAYIDFNNESMDEIIKLLIDKINNYSISD